MLIQRPSFFPANARRRPGSALVLVLLGITMISVLTVTLLFVSRYERTAAGIALGKSSSDSLADAAADLATLKLRQATEAGMATNRMWVSEPGRIRVFQRDDLTQFIDYPLFSTLPGTDSTTRDLNNVDLNRPNLDGEFPIAPPAPGESRANMKVGWLNLPADPGSAPSASNKLVGRIAFWIDDESCKVNINTADGTRKYTKESYGFGTPTEISLEALKDAGDANLSKAVAGAIADHAWSAGFNSSAEIGRVPGLPADFYRTNKFNISVYNKAPDLTFYGEPRLNLLPNVLIDVGSGSSQKTYAYTMLTGPSQTQANATSSQGVGASEAIDFIYPTSRQLPRGLPTGTYSYRTDQQQMASNTLPQYPLNRAGGAFNSPTSTKSSRAANFVYGLRIVQSLNGADSQGGDVIWPAFSGNNQSPATKYNKRQRDSIALQIIDMTTNAAFADYFRGYSHPSVSSGILDNQTQANTRVELAVGVGRGAKFTEMIVTAEHGIGNPFATASDVPYIQMNVGLEFYFPKFYRGTPLNKPYDSSAANQWALGSRDVYLSSTIKTEVLNEVDVGTATDAASLLNPNSFWMNTLLHIPGVDLSGNPAYISGSLPMADPDQAAAASFHPYALTSISGQSKYQGVQISKKGFRRPFLDLGGPSSSDGQDTWHSGVYHSQNSVTEGNTPYFGQNGTDISTITGGIVLRTKNESGTPNWEFSPLDGLRGTSYSDETIGSIVPLLKKAVIPVNFEAPDTYNARVADPLVNKFPGDWIIDLGGTKATCKLNIIAGDVPGRPASAPAIYARGGNINNPDFVSTSSTRLPLNFDGDNPEFKPSGGGDPLSVWLPRTDVRYTKQSRFPSVGGLNYVRTGIIPDDLSVDLSQQHGTPWRSINLSSESSSQKTYPDWALLDLFTVPFVPQPVYYVGQTPTTKRLLTSGGATEGKLNINNPRVAYPFSQAVTGVSQTPPIRTAPLDALFYGIKTSTSYDSNGDPVYEVIDATKTAQLRDAVQNKLDDSGPFVLTGQLATVAAINDYTYKGVADNARSRNDLMREVIGATTVQGNVFSIWVVSQSVKKNPRNSGYGTFEQGDTIVAETRRRYIVERHIDYGKDGVPGNASGKSGALGTDGLLGTEDDVIDPDYHPALTYPLPYKWKIVAVENSDF